MTLLLPSHFGNDRLYIVWVDDDDNNVHVKSFVPQPGGALLPASNVKLDEHSSNDAGPALAFANGRLFLAWTDVISTCSFSLLMTLTQRGGKASNSWGTVAMMPVLQLHLFHRELFVWVGSIRGSRQRSHVNKGRPK